MEDKGTHHLFLILSKPVEWTGWLAQKSLGLSDGSTAMLGWLCLGIYWMIIGGFIGLGISVLYSKVAGDE